MPSATAGRRKRIRAPTICGPVVMGTGIVSVSLELGHHNLPSRILLGLAAAGWVALALQTIARTRRGRSAPRSVSDLSGVAATAVVGSRVLQSDARGLAVALVIAATALWLLLTVSVRRLPSVGSSFLITVAPQSLAVLSAALAASFRLAWLAWLALVLCALGILLYVWALRRFDLHQLREGAGDHWIAGGALAISALSLGELGNAFARADPAGGLVGALHTAGVVVWSASAAWLLVLLVCEARWPRLRYDERRWSTVFPVGMYAACSFEVGRASALHTIVTFADVWSWVAVAVWLAVAVGSVLDFFSS